MDTMRTLAGIIAFCTMFGMASVCNAAVAHEVAPPKISFPEAAVAETSPDPEPAKPALDDACRLKGVVVCSEYGARQKEDLMLILVDEQGYRHDAVIYKDDGTFYTRIPCSGTYTMRIELGEGGFELGTITLPAADDDATYGLKIIHPGSMLELILEARTSNCDDLTYRQPIVVPSKGY
jgi:hypothetical protein